MNEILSISHYSEKSARLRIANKLVAAKARPGQFVIIKFIADGQRIPFPIVDTAPDEGVIDVIIHRADGLDSILSLIKEGNVLPDLLGPLGTPAVIEQDKTVIFVGDGGGFVPLLPLIKASHTNGCKVMAIVSEMSSRTKCLLGDISSECDEMTIVNEPEVPELLQRWITSQKPAKIVFSGPTMLVKQLAGIARMHNVPAECVLNMLMIDGIGICGVCRVTVGGKQKQTCVDGPIFNAWEVDYDDIMNRQRSFI